MDMTFFEQNEAKIPKGKVRTRFAPSPTGYMHVGGLRTALYTWLIARKNGGTFILRVEDTDQERLVEGADEIIFRTLRCAGLDYDEGPDVGGPVGPYVQTERRGLYLPYAQYLVEKGAAYYCFCTKDRLDELRRIHEASRVPHKYDGLCASLSKEEIARRVAEGQPYVIRQKIPQSGTTSFSDTIFGEITVENSTLDDNVLIKADGLPTYNFANVIDDHLMGITHICRGSEYLSSTPKYNLLYEAFGWEIPVYIHMSPVMRDAQHKLSKRSGDPTYEDLLAQGYLKEAIMNYVALLGWSPRSEREIFSTGDLAGIFDLEGLSKSPAIFDLAKLGWFNASYLRAMTPGAFYAAAEPYISQTVTKALIDKKAIAALLQERCEKLGDVPEQVDFFDKLPDYNTELYVHKKMKTDLEISLASLGDVLPVLEALGEWTPEALHDALIGLAQRLEKKNGQIMYPVRVAVSGKAFTPGGAVELCAILGREETLARIKEGIAKLK